MNSCDTAYFMPKMITIKEFDIYLFYVDMFMSNMHTPKIPILVLALV